MDKKCYIVIYDLIGINNRYDLLYDKLKSYGTWARITESCWAIVSEKQAKDIRNDLLSVMEPDSRIMVIKSGGKAAWKNTIGSNEWFKKHLPTV